MKPKFTIGPYKVVPNPLNSSLKIEAEVSDGSFVVAVTPSFQECDIHNARLLATAPELFWMLKEARSLVEREATIRARGELGQPYLRDFQSRIDKLLNKSLNG
jgi:hypothetical protein